MTSTENNGSINSDVSEGVLPYSSLTADQRGTLAAGIDMSDMNVAMSRLTEINSDAPVSDADAKVLGWVQTFYLGLKTQKRDKIVTRPKKGGRHGSLDAFIAGLDNGASGIDPDDVVYVLDEDKNEVMVTLGQGDNKRRVPIVEARGSATATSGVSVRLDSGEVYPLANGKKPVAADVGGEEAYRRITAFSRDGGETWGDVRWTLTLPNARTAGN